MSDNNPESEQVSLSNHIINLANDAMGDGHAAEDVAESLRHAAANFSAYAFSAPNSHPRTQIIRSKALFRCLSIILMPTNRKIQAVKA